MFVPPFVGAGRAPSFYSRREFLKVCAVLASTLALPASLRPAFAVGLSRASRQSVIWLSSQGCAGCLESLTRADAPTLEHLLFDLVSLDFLAVLQAAAGDRAESACREATEQHRGEYVLLLEGSIPLGAGGAYSTCAGRSALDVLAEFAEGARAILAVGSCAAFGGLPEAFPNPTEAAGVQALMERGLIPERPLVNLPGCPPVPVVISAVLAHLVVLGSLPQLDDRKRPLAAYGHTVHERCARLVHFQRGEFAASFDDEGARQGWCLYKLGCKGLTTHSACPVSRWNLATSYPVGAGHPCIGCTEPGFWDAGGFYEAAPTEAAETPAARAEALFRARCGGCHPNAASLRTPAEELGGALASDRYPLHKALRLTPAEIETLEGLLRPTH